MIRRPWIFLAVWFGLSVAIRAPNAHGEKGVVFESHTAKQFVNGYKLWEPLFDELGRLGFQSGAGLSERVSAAHSATGEGLESDRVAAARQLIRSAHNSYIGADFLAAAEGAQAGLQALFARPATVARQPDLRDDVYLALVTLAMACNRLGRSDCVRDTVYEFARSFPDREASRKRFGPEGANLFRTYSQELAQRGTGRLRIEVDSANDLVFINERFVGVGSIELDLLEGEFRVYTQHGSLPGRVRRVRTYAGRTQRVRVDRTQERVLRNQGDFVGFVFVDDEERRGTENELALEIAKSLGASQVVLLSMQPHPGKQGLSARLLDVAADRIERSALIPWGVAQPPSEESLRALARFMVTATQSDAIEIVDPKREGETLRSLSKTVPRPSRGWNLAGLIGGGCMVAAGTALLVVDGRGTCDLENNQRECPNVVETGLYGYLSVGFGLGLAAASWALWPTAKAPANKANTAWNLSVSRSPGFAWGVAFGRVY